MFDDLDDGSFSVSEVEKEIKPAYSGNSKGNWTPGGNNFKKKEEVVEEPYSAVAIYIDKDFPEEIKKSLIDLIGKFVAKKIVVRVNGDDKELYERIRGLSDKYIEWYIPWKNFSEIESKFYYNTLTAKHLAQVNFPAWDKVPDVVKAMLARNVRMIFGDKNNSGVICLITWSQDGATKVGEISKDTGRASFSIRVANSNYYPVINTGKQGALNMVERSFNL